MFGELILSIVLLLVATIIRIDTASYPDFSKTVTVGAEVFPNIIAGFLYFAAVVFLLKIAYTILIKKRDETGKSYLEQEKEAVLAGAKKVFGNRAGLLGTVGILILMILYAVFLKTVGFELCTLAFIAGAMLCCGERRPLFLILTPICTMVAILVVFKIILKVPLPMLFFTNL